MQPYPYHVKVHMLFRIGIFLGSFRVVQFNFYLESDVYHTYFTVKRKDLGVFLEKASLHAFSFVFIHTYLV